MKRMLKLLATALLLANGAGSAWADIVLTAPDGRRVVLKDDGTWRYQDAPDKAKADAKGKPEVQAVLRLERKIERGVGCRLVFSLDNKLPLEIRNIVPFFSVYRPNGVLHETVSVAFQSIRASDRGQGSADFTKINCADIARVQVVGGDRCEIGELHKFSEGKGMCLALVDVAPSDLTRFDK